MRWPFREPPGFSFDQYHGSLRQIARMGDAAARRALAKADRLANVLAEAQRRSPDRSDWPDHAQLARAAEMSRRQLCHFLEDLDAMATFVEGMRSLGPLGRLKTLISAPQPTRDGR